MLRRRRDVEPATAGRSVEVELTAEETPGRGAGRSVEVELTAEEAPGAQRPRRTAVLAIVAVVAYGIDLLTKVIVVAELEGAPSIELLGGLLTLRVIRNPGAAFGIAGGFTIVLSLIMAAVIVVIVRAARRLRSLGWAVALGLILGGALGNLTDRLLRAPGPLAGHVVDWIEVPYWPVFNLADSAIVCGGLLAVVLAFRGIGLDGHRATKRTDEQLAADSGEGGRE
ncbi:MAG: signal peptidase II [Streptosporangiales bacterium]|nr:signal peptidase II [Streptosporangiales bacterium]